MKPVIGLEVHIELKTKSKMFCGCSADYFGQKPNTHTCPVCLGLPGALPVPNKKAIEWCVMLGMALGCEIPLFSKFDRKNYFYPDLPKGYQISQFDEPFCLIGSIKLDSGKTIRITRVHMEEDTAKLVHQFGTQNSTLRLRSGRELKTQNFSLIDFNRSGVPLVEIVTEPDFDNAKDVIDYLKKLQQIARYLNISNADMEKGDMRLEPNISLKECHPEHSEGSKDSSPMAQNDNLPSYKVEVKNINSFRFVEKAINFEIERQTEILNRGLTPKQETRGWDESKQETVTQRVKEESSDYRYFPEPDIPPIRWIGSQTSSLKSQIGELPEEKLRRFKKDYELSDYDAEILTREKTMADYFEEAVTLCKKHKLAPKKIANFIINRKIDVKKILPAKLIEQIISSDKTGEINDEDLRKIIKEVLKNNPKIAGDYKKGKKSVIQFAIGQVMYIIRKKIDTEILRKIIMEELK